MGSTVAEIQAALDLFREDKYWQECIKSEGPQHKVILTQPIYLSVHEVTQKEYEGVMKKNPSHFSSMGPGNDVVVGLDTASHPVEMVSWNDAAEFCAKLSDQENLKPFYSRDGQTVTPLNGTGYRLPTEAEWEFACRAGTTTKFWTGDRDESLVAASWNVTNSGARTHKVGGLSANPLALSDIHGNVWEWCQDWYGQDYYGPSEVSDPQGPTEGSTRVLRGGGWGNSSVLDRSADRHCNEPAGRNDDVGFRVALVVPTRLP